MTDEWSNEWEYPDRNDPEKMVTFIKHNTCGKSMPVKYKGTHKCGEGFKTANEAHASHEDNKWMNPVYADCFNFVLELIEAQGNTGKVFDGNAFASMLNTLFTRRVGK